MQVLQQIIAGLEDGSVFSLIGLAIVVIMKSTDVPNFAVAQMGIMCAYLGWFLSAEPDEGGVGWPFWLAIIIALLFAGVFGAATQFLLIRPLVGLSNRPLAYAAAAVLTYMSIDFLHREGLPSFLDWFPTPDGGWSWGAAVPLGILAGILTFLAARAWVKPLAKVDHFPLLLLTIGMTWALLSGNQLLWGVHARSFDAPWDDKTPLKLTNPDGSVRLIIGADEVVAIGTGLAIAIAVGIFFKSKWGVRMRAIAEDGTTARLLGINSGRISLLAWAMGIAIGAIALILRTTSAVLDVSTANVIILKGFIAAVLGGFTSLLGTFAGGMVIGVGESLVGGQISTSVQAAVALMVVVVVLLVVPGGLTREKSAREV